MKLTSVSCPLCKYSESYTVVYPANFRIGDLNRSVFSARRMPDKIHYQVVKCNVCGLVRSTPTMQTGHLYTLYKESRMTYTGEIDHLIRTYVRALKPVLSLLPYSARLLEIGCGNGFLVKALRDLGYKNTYGMEPSTDAIQKAHSSVKKNLRCSVLKPGIFRKKSFDFIFFFQTLDHVPRPNGFLRECNRLLKPRGYVLSFNHNIDSLSSRILGERSPIVDIEHTFLYSPKTISLLFQKNGFMVETVYSPLNFVSFRHIMWLSPIPKSIKKSIMRHTSGLLNMTIHIPLGNLCFVGRKV